LLAAVPIPDPTVQRKRIILAGDVPSPIKLPAGCRFHTRCPYAFDRCRIEEPGLKEATPEHLAACHLREVPIAITKSILPSVQTRVGSP
jgi:peptide/nickel transport system ATP-binding protein